MHGEVYNKKKEGHYPSKKSCKRNNLNGRFQKGNKKYVHHNISKASNKSNKKKGGEKSPPRKSK